ncbi:unnamed protein product, partial [Lampetra planeri]
SVPCPVVRSPHVEAPGAPLARGLRLELGLQRHGFSLLITDKQLRPKRSYESPVAMETVLKVLDGTAGRRREEEEERRRGLGCEEAARGGGTGDGGAALGDFLSRFLWRRRLLIVSAASGEDAAYEQQLHALQGQGCSLGRRLIVVLKLLGLDDQAGGIMEGHGLSGNVSVETEAMSAHLVSEVRSYFRLSPEVYGSVLVESDGVPLAWFPAPVRSYFRLSPEVYGSVLVESDGVPLAWFPAPVVAVALLYELLDGGHGGGGGQAEWGLPPCPEHDHNYGYYGHYPQHGGHRY